MTSPYRKPESLPLEPARVAGDVFLPPAPHSAAFSRLLPAGVLLVVLSATFIFGGMLGKGDFFGSVVIVLWWSVTLGPPLGALWDATLAHTGYRKRPATVLGERLSYRVWGLRRTIEPKDLSATRKMGRDVLLALRNDVPSIVFRPRTKSGDPPAWMTDREDKGDGSWSFVWRSRSRVFLGSRGTVAWLGAVFAVTAVCWSWRRNCYLVFLLLPILVMGFVGVALQILLQYELHRTALLTCYRGVWLLHVGSQSKRYVLPVETQNGLGTPSLRVRIGDDEVLWEPPGGALTADSQAALISALAADARERCAPATTTGGAGGSNQ